MMFESRVQTDDRNVLRFEGLENPQALRNGDSDGFGTEDLKSGQNDHAAP